MYIIIHIQEVKDNYSIIKIYVIISNEDRKEENMSTKKKLSIIMVSLVISIIGLLGTIYLYKRGQDSPVSEEVNDYPDDIKGSSIIFNYANDAKSIEVNNMAPTLDKFGVLNDGFVFSIKNTSNSEKDYVLKLLDDNSTIRNNYVRYQLIKKQDEVGIFTLPEDGIIDIGKIMPSEEINYTLKIWLSYDSNIKFGTLNKHIGIMESSVVLDNSGAVSPSLTEGMIPVYYDYNDNSFHKADTLNNYYYTWYNYEKGLWANVVTVNKDKRNYYIESNVGTNIEMSDINSIWVWIPRFNYIKGNDSFNVKFVGKEESAYDAFTFNKKNIEGFWITKFEAGMLEDSICIQEKMTNVCNNSNNTLYFKPNIPVASRMTMANLFYSFRKMELKNNIYGFVSNGTKLNNDGTIKGDNNKIDIHMVKALEWQAVAILSNSVYGKLGNNDFDNLSKYVYTNNTDYTGKSYYNKEVYDYNIKESGTGASTTGNITGVYDMNGGKREYVMINNYNGNIFNKKSNSGFTSNVKDYYYDNLENKDMLFTVSSNDEKEINSNPLTRGGYINSGDIFSLYGVSDYYNKISLQVNSRATLVIGE